ncbi:MAG: VCBS repeat-containing protein [bacterium]|nr:VCBS repeat-containing protein [bacterium]
MKKLSIQLIVWCLIPGFLFSQTSFKTIFHRIEIDMDVSIEDIFTEDLDGADGRDLLVVTKAVRGKQDKRLHIYFQTRSGFPTQPDQVLEFDKRAVVFEPVDISDQHKGKELLFLTGNSLEYYYLENNRYRLEPRQLAALSSVFLAPSKEGPVRGQLVRFIGENNSPVIFIPGPAAMTLLKKNAGGQFKPFQQLNIVPSFRTSSHYNLHRTDSPGENFSQKIVIRVPRIYLEDFDGDKDKDIISIVKDRIEVFFNKGEGEFSQTPGFGIDLELLTETEKEKFFVPNTSKNVIDLDGNGLADIAVTKTSFKATGSLTKIYFYINKKGKIEAKPDQVMMLGNSINIPVLRDLNGDGHKDLVTPEAKMGLLQIIKILISGKLSYRQSVYLSKNGKFAAEPDLRLKAEARFDLENPQDMEGEFIYFGNDFNGDSVKDLLRTESSTSKMLIFYGVPGSKTLFSPKPAYEIKEALMPRECLIHDLNGDKISDIIFDYRKNKKKKVVVFLSKVNEPHDSQTP